MDKEHKKKLIMKYGRILSSIFRFVNWNKKHIHGHNNEIRMSGVFSKHCRFHIKGNNNSILIKGGITRLSYCTFIILGNYNKITIDADSNLNNATFHIENDHGSIHLNQHVTITGATNFAVIEGKSISIGEDCLFSDQIEFRVGDSHSIIDSETGKRINPSMDIAIGNHVWIGHDCKILKGAKIGDNSIIATGSIITKKQYPEHSVIAGIPAKVVKQNINWKPERIAIQQ